MWLHRYDDILGFVKPLLNGQPEQKKNLLVEAILALSPSNKADLKYLTVEQISGVIPGLRASRFIDELKIKLTKDGKVECIYYSF